MIVSAKLYREVREELVVERAKREELSRRCESQNTMIEFLCAQLNHVTKERALLIRTATGLDVPVPEFTRQHQPVSSPESPTIADAILGRGIFADDPRNAPRGWNDDGTVNYDDAPVKPRTA